MKKIKPYLLILFFIGNIQMTNAQKNNAADESYIRNARTASNTAIAKKNVAGVAKYWMEDYVEISSDGSLISGKDAVMADWNKMFLDDSTITFERQFKEISFAKNGIVALEKGILKYPSYNYEGLYTALWRKIDGVWTTQLENFVSLQ